MRSLFALIALATTTIITTTTAWQVYEPDLSIMNDPIFWDKWKPRVSDTPWRTCNGNILHNNKTFYVKGASLNGFESGASAPLGLWRQPLSFYLDFLRNNSFNVVRVPIPYESMIWLDRPIGDSVSAEPMFRAGMPFKAAFSILLDELHRRDMYALPDMHTQDGVITERPPPNNDGITAWLTFADHFGDHPALMGLELKNEAHGDISLHELETWEGRVIYNIDIQVPKFKGLYVLGGTSYKGSAAWGGSYQDDDHKRTYLMSFAGLTHPSSLCAISGEYTDRFVLSPHVYSVDVRGNAALFEDESTWEATYGFIHGMENHWKNTPILVTEYGGDMSPSSQNGQWYNKWLKWHTNTKNITAGAFAWTTGSEFSTDTKGLITMDGVIDFDKLDFAARLTPNPTFG